MQECAKNAQTLGETHISMIRTLERALTATAFVLVDEIFFLSCYPRRGPFHGSIDHAGRRQIDAQFLY